MAHDAFAKQLPESMAGPVRAFTETIQQLAGQKALALTLFGSIVAGAFDAKRHNVKSVLVMETVDLEFLRTLSKAGPRLGKARISAPLIMTPDYITASLDTFPLEFLEIKQQHLCVFGQDYFADLTLGAPQVRHQCERELKTILLGMRQALLGAAGRESILGEIETEVAERLTRTLRGMLWLQGQEPASVREVVAAVEASLKRNLGGLRSAIDELGRHGWEEFKELYGDVDALRTYIDAW